MNRQRFMAQAAVFASGCLFAFGLSYAHMTNSDKLWNFLDFFGGRWDPSLAFVMLGGIGVYTLLFFVKGDRPVFAETFSLPSASKVDKKLVLGAAIFGCGWGIAGLCPGPAVASLATGRTSILVFVGFLVLGNFVYKILHQRS